MLVWNSRDDIYQAALRIERVDTAVHEEGILREGSLRNASSMLEWSGQPSQYRRRPSDTSSFGGTRSQTGSVRPGQTFNNRGLCNQCGRDHSKECRKPPRSTITVRSLCISPKNAPGEACKGWLSPSSLSGVV
ncbi:unnamed protein product [Linum trigynum]|uniref:Uncharacterized protein n=1 Tax=Linum trigynum TaxID=586398 RepID=A0AAV2CH04_9ROSI